MKRYQIYTAAFWVVLGLFVSLYAYWLGPGRIDNPGPGFFPFCLGLIFLLLAVAIFIRALRGGRQPEAAREDEPGASLLKVGLVLAVLFIYALFFEFLGYPIATFVALALLFRLGGYRRLVQILGYSAAVVAVTYLFFSYLGVRFPSGLFKLLGID